ncbi:hypothetical protein ACFX2I_000212 [Malus domestica]
MKSSTRLDSALFQLTQPETAPSHTSGIASSSLAALSTLLEMLWFQGHVGGREGPLFEPSTRGFSLLRKPSQSTIQAKFLHNPTTVQLDSLNVSPQKSVLNPRQLS